MTSDIKNSLEHQNHIIETEFKAIFCNKKMHRLLDAKISSFQLWYYCMCDLIMIEAIIQSKQDPMAYSSQTVSYWIKRMVTIFALSLNTWIKTVLNKNGVKDVDLLFISKDRFITTNVGKKLITSDSLFFNVIQKLSQNFPSTTKALLCTAAPPDDINIKAYNIFNYIYPTDILNSFFKTIITVSQGKFAHNSIVPRSRSNDLLEIPISRRVASFFSFKKVFYCYLIDYSFTHSISQLNPKIIISNDDVMMLKPKSQMSEFGFITMQSGLVYPVLELYRRLFIEEFGSELVKADYFLCTGDYFKPLKDFSRVSKKVIVSGQPRYDNLVNAAKIYNRKQILTDLGLDPNKKMVLWTTSTHSLCFHENIDCINAVYSTMMSLTDVQLVIKLHPDENENAPFYKTNTCFKPVIADKDADTDSLLFACDLMITKSSTTAMEAIILNRPAIILNLSGEPDKVNYVKEGVAIGVYKPDQLEPAITSLLTDDRVLAVNRDAYIKKYLHRIDGKATARVVEVIIQELQKKVKV